MLYRWSCIQSELLCIPIMQLLYIVKSQQYVKKRIQEHIGEVTKLYSKLILPNSRPAAHCTSSTCHSQSTPPTRTSSSLSGTRTQDSYVLPPTYLPRCMVLNDANPPGTNAEPNDAIMMETLQIAHKFDKQPRSNELD